MTRRGKGDDPDCRGVGRRGGEVNRMAEGANGATEGAGGAARRRRGLLVLAWLWVGLPFAYGAFELARKMVQLFGG